MIDFKDMSNIFGLVYTVRLGDCINHMFIFLFFLVVLKSFIVLLYDIKYSYNTNDNSILLLQLLVLLLFLKIITFTIIITLYW